MQYYTPINMLTCDTDKLEFMDDCAAGIVYMLAVGAASLLLAAGLALFFVKGPGKKLLDKDGRQQIHDRVLGLKAPPELHQTDTRRSIPR